MKNVRRYYPHSKTLTHTLTAMHLQHSMLHAEETTFIGWLLYSTINIDVGGLSDAIYETLGFEVGLRWMDIHMSNKGGKGKAKPVKAVHVEVEKSRAEKSRKH